MRRPNLSFENLAFTLAALSLGACTKASEPAAVRTDPQKPASSAVTTPATNSPQQGAPSGVAQDEPSPKPGIAGASATEVPHEPPKLERKKKDHGTGSASCGAGTCSADMKTK